MNKYSFAFQKKFGQNFLIDLQVIDEIVSSADLTEDDVVVEIGPGIGSLTQHLAEQAGQVICVEIDKALIPILENDTLKDYDNVRIINEDILKVDLKKIIDEEYGGKKIKVVANLPYYITTPIIMGLFEGDVPLDRIIVMIQKEVADRMQAKPSTKDYGTLSLAVQYHSEPEIVTTVPLECFIPRPKVSSAVICLKKHEKPTIETKDSKLMFKLIRVAFSQRRKTLTNTIKNSSELYIDKEDVLEALRTMDVSESVRGEALSLEQFAKLSDLLVDKVINK